MRSGSGAAVLVLLMMTAGCATPQPSTTTAGEAAREATEAADYVRRVEPFEVRDAAGTPYALPFLGGLNVPRAQFRDIDADGDPDLFVQEVTNEVMFFENVGVPTQHGFVWRTDKYWDLDIGEWVRFADIDDDGDFDVLAEQPYSYIRYYRNVGTPHEARFELAADSLKNAQGEPIFSDRQNIPNITDLDCDGRLDLFLGRVDGTMTRYEAVEAGEALPRFKLVTDRFENIEIIGQIQMGSARHGANTLTFADVDNDGDQDLFWGDFFEPGLLLIENTGSCAAPVLRSEPIPFPTSDPVTTSGYNAPAFTDIDGDSDEDLFMGVLGGAFNPNTTSDDNFYFFERTETDFELRTQRFLYGIDVGTESFARFADLDADSDQDLLLANKIAPHDPTTARLYRFENTGTSTQPSFQLADSLDLPSVYHYAPTLGDLDADGDLDMLVGTWNEGIMLYRNTGSASNPVLELEAESYLELTRGSNSTPFLIDIDADGDLDLFVGEASGTINYYENTGTPQAPQFELVSDEYEGIDVGRRSVPVFLDLDGDGDQDMVVGREHDGLAVYRNTGSPEAPSFVLEENALPLPVPAYATPAFVDIDGDGDQDVFTGGIGGGLLYFERQ